MKVEVLSALLIQWFYHKHKVLSERRRAFMTKLYQVSCLKYNNKTDFYRYGKDIHGRQKYQCKKFQHQWASEASRQLGRPKRKEYPSCLVCRKATFLHHHMEHYSNYRCCNKKWNYSMFVSKPTSISTPSMSKLFG